MVRMVTVIVFISMIQVLASGVLAHCQIPCGIYGDEMRFDMMNEHVSTIEKSMQMIIELSGEGEMNYNQLIRWVMNKETHAEHLQELAYQYFLAQRVKPVDREKKNEYREYVNKIELLHHIIVYAMRAKQTTDLAHVARLRSLISDFKTAYFSEVEEGHKH